VNNGSDIKENHLTYVVDKERNKKFRAESTRLRGHAVAQLVEALRYNPEGRGLIPDGVIGIFY
jgi:hypothetical protein